MQNLIRNLKSKCIFSFALTLIFTFLFAVSLLASEFPIMPMPMSGTINDEDGKPVGEGVIKVFVDDKLILEKQFNSGELAVTLDPEDETNKNEFTRNDLGKPVKFTVIIDEKEYEAQILAPDELLFQEGGVPIDNVILKVDYSAGSSGTSGGGGATAQAPAVPVASPATGDYTDSVKVVLISATDSAVIYYTTDDTDPKNSSSRKEYKEPVDIQVSTTLKAVSYKDNLYSNAAVFMYNISAETQQPTTQPPAADGQEQTVDFVDLQGHWATEVIQKMVEEGIVAGYEDKTFRPDNNINRVECAAIIARAMNLSENDTQSLDAFSDVSDIPSWGQGSVAASVAAGYLKGYPVGDSKIEFEPLKNITRVELAAVLARVSTEKLDTQQIQATNFADQEKIPEWAKDAVDTAVQAGLIKGYPDGTFQPQKDVTRAEAVAMLDRLLVALNALNSGG